MVLIVLAIVFIFTFDKKRREVGKTWYGSATITIKDKDLSCSHCGHNKFAKREGLLNTTWVSFFRFAFWNQSARCFVCKNCGFLHWFVYANEKAEIDEIKY